MFIVVVWLLIEGSELAADAGKSNCCLEFVCNCVSELAVNCSSEDIALGIGDNTSSSWKSIGTGLIGVISGKSSSDDTLVCSVGVEIFTSR